MDNTIKRINEILTENNQMMVSRPDGLFEIKNVKDKSEKKTFFQWFESKFFGLLEECQNEYERFEKMKNLKYSYECPECGKLMRFESEVTIIRCDKCDHVFNIEIQRAIKETEKENPYLRMSAYPMEDFGYTNGSPRKGDDWKILDVNDLSDCPDILYGDYQFQYRNIFPSGGYSLITIVEHTTQSERLGILKNDNLYYRLTQTKKTHEDRSKEIEEILIKESIEYTNKKNGLEGIVQDHLLFLTKKLSEVISKIESMESES